MKIAIEGCAHGELDRIYEAVKRLEENEGITVDLLICCGDFQSSRNIEDLRCMAVPPKYYNICSFYKYYSGEKVAPVLTIFIGGNHEASNYLQELPYGGWVAPNIFYMGYAGVINIAGVRIGGLSGIFKGRDYMKGHYERSPYDENTKRSVYHIRNLEVFRLKQISTPMDIFLSHDWPANISSFGNQSQLLRFKPFFKDDIESGKLGSKPAEELLYALKPEYWFSAHLHCKFSALVPHEDGKCTKFLALDKCLPKKRFLQIVDVPHKSDTDIMVPRYDLEWLTILRLTNHLTSAKNETNYMPGPGGMLRWDFSPTEEDLSKTLAMMGDLDIPRNFVRGPPAYSPSHPKRKNVQQPKPLLNRQTAELCNRLLLDDPMQLLLDSSPNDVTFYDDETEQTDDAFDGTTFIDETTAADATVSLSNSNNSFSSSNRVMLLPEPVTKNESFSEDPEAEERSKSPEIALGNVCAKDSEDKDTGVFQEKAPCSVNADSSAKSPVVKAFKRRNADLYKSEES